MKVSMTRIGLLSLAMLVLIGCGKGSGPGASDSELKLSSGRVYRTLGDRSQLTTGSTVSGTGTIQFKDGLSKMNADHSFPLKFQLQAGGSLTLLAFGGEALKDAVRVKFTRDVGRPLFTTTVQGNEGAAQTVAIPPTWMSENGAFDLIAEVQQSHGHDGDYHCYFVKGSEVITSEFQGRGPSVSWGLALDKATLTFADFGRKMVDHGRLIAPGGWSR